MPLTPEQVEELKALFTPARPRTDADADVEAQAAEIILLVDQLLSMYRAPEREILSTAIARKKPVPAVDDIAAVAEKVRAYAKEEIERLYTQAHAKVATVKRVGLMLRIERLASGKWKPKPVKTDRGLMGFYDRRISDAELQPIVRMWNSTKSGAKKGGAVGKWELLRRLLKKYDDKTTVAALQSEWKEFRNRLAANGRGMPGD